MINGVSSNASFTKGRRFRWTYYPTLHLSNIADLTSKASSMSSLQVCHEGDEAPGSRKKCMQTGRNCNIKISPNIYTRTLCNLKYIWSESLLTAMLQRSYLQSVLWLYWLSYCNGVNLANGIFGIRTKAGEVDDLVVALSGRAGFEARIAAGRASRLVGCLFFELHPKACMHAAVKAFARGYISVTTVTS